MKTLTQKMNVMGAARRKKIDARAAALIADEMTLRSGKTGVVIDRAHPQHRTALTK